MTAKQKAAREKFKKVVAEASKLRKKNPKLTQAQAVKQAWAISYSKAGQSKKVGALPNSFKGAIMDIPFKVYHQYDIYGDVTSIIEDTESGNTIVKVDGKGTAKDKAEAFYNYLSKYSKWDKKDYAPSLKTKLNKFVSNLHQEVKDFNAGRKKTIKQMPIKIAEPKKSVKKSNPVKSAKTTSKQRGSSNIQKDKLYQAKKPGKRKTSWGTTYYESRANRSDRGVLLGTKDSYHKDTKSHNVNIRVMSGLFDTSVIKDLDQLKKEYFKLAKTYHPDAGGTKEQFQALQNEYEKLLKNLINGSSLSSDQKKNEFEVDKAIRDIIDSIISLEGINIELVGKWLWISGNTYPVRNELKKAGLLYIKKDGFPYWVYKGSMSRGRGNLSIDEIKQKYGSRVIESRQVPKIGSIGQVKINKNKFGSAIQKLVRSLNKRPV